LKTVEELETMDRKEFAELIADKLNAKLIEIRGYNLILQKKDI
jgi:RNA-binding protein YhbY